MAQKKSENYRNRTHMILLYEDDITHKKALEKIQESYDYALCYHDKDCDEDGVIKKPHYHVVVRFTNQTWRSALCKDLGIETNYCEEVKNFDNALMYLIHYNDSEKYQYEIEEVKGTLKKRLKEVINKNSKSEGEKVYELIAFIEEQDDKITVKNFAKYCATNGYWSEFRRSGAIFLKIIDEHNQKYVQLDQKLAH